MTRYLCIHGHFYQPPRENPWLESLEVQDSAWPFHDWNERVHHECYRPNAAARIVGSDGLIHRVYNNYARISFNFGPTLLSWMEEAPHDYARILEADKRSVARFWGHGSAIAQAYNHLIMPLATARDRRTQVKWGVEDFRHRFGREPEGMWLPETAVCVDSLEALAEQGIKFTILEPGQAARFRPLSGGSWQECAMQGLDCTRPYVQRLPSGKEIALFFYDGSLSRAVAFEKLLDDGVRFAGRLNGLFRDDAGHVQLASIATDGETYGHHHRFGEMALASALTHVQVDGTRLTNYGEFLELHPPQWEVEIRENTAWSCAHGVERWRSDCGCGTGGNPGWNQRWRAPLRESLDWLRDTVEGRFEEVAGRLLKDPWAARDGYIRVLLDRSPERFARFLEEHAARALTEHERSDVACLMEVQRHAQLMYTSCGWFFDDLAGLEGIQILRYAGRVLQLSQEVLSPSLETEFLARLGRAHSNDPDKGGGARVFEESVRPSRISLAKVAAHWAVSSLFKDYDDQETLFSYRIERLREARRTAGDTQLAAGKVRVTSRITLRSQDLAYGVIHFGEHNLSAGVAPAPDEATQEALEGEMVAAFEAADLPGMVRCLDRHLGDTSHSLTSLFRDEQRRIVQEVLKGPLADAEEASRRLYRDYAVLMRYLKGLGAHLPRALTMTATWLLALDVRMALEAEPADLDAIERHLEAARGLGLELATPGFTRTMEAAIERAALNLLAWPQRTEQIDHCRRLVELTRMLCPETELWRMQNACWSLIKSELAVQREDAAKQLDGAQPWVDAFEALGAVLYMRVEPPPA